MTFNRILAILQQELYIARRSLILINDLFLFTTISLIVFGFTSNYISSSSPIIAAYLLLGFLLWEVMRITQYSISNGALWNLWYRNLSNLFVSPLSISEFLIANIISSTLKAFLVLIIGLIILSSFFHFDVLRMGWGNLWLIFINLCIFGWSVGILILGMIFKFGMKLSALAWGMIYLIQPITGSLFPIDVLPIWLQQIAVFIPLTHIFQAARNGLATQTIDWPTLSVGFVENCIYLILTIWLFQKMYDSSRRTGQFAKNDA